MSFGHVYSVYTLSYNYAMDDKPTQVVISIRINKELKEKATKIFNDMGTDLSGGIKLFLNHVVTEGVLGFEPMTKDGLKFKYFQEYKRQLARERGVWKEFYSAKQKK